MTQSEIAALPSSLVSLGFLLGEPDAQARWLEATGQVSEWDAEFADLLDFITGVNDESDVRSYLRADGFDEDVVDDLISEGLLLRLTGTPEEKVRCLAGRRLIATCDLVEVGDPARGVNLSGVLRSRIDANSSTTVGEPMLSVLSAPTTEDIPTLIERTAVRLGAVTSVLSEHFLLELDRVIGGRTAFIGAIAP